MNGDAYACTGLPGSVGIISLAAIRGGMPSPFVCGEMVAYPYRTSSSVTCVAVFSANHRQHLLIAFRHFDEMLAGVLDRIGAEPGRPLFELYRRDVDARTLMCAQVAASQLRQAMLGFMARHDLRAPPTGMDASHSAQAMLALMLVGATELGARHLLGYGDLSGEEGAELDVLAADLRERVVALEATLRGEAPR